MAKKDKVVLPYMNWKFGLRSIMHWIIPFGARNMRMRPAFTVLSFLFHICLLYADFYAGPRYLVEGVLGHRLVDTAEP